MVRLGAIKDWSNLSNNKDMIKRLKGHLEMADVLDKVIGMDQYQSSKKTETNGCYDGPCSKGCTKTLKQGWLLQQDIFSQTQGNIFLVLL